MTDRHNNNFESEPYLVRHKGAVGVEGEPVTLMHLRPVDFPLPAHLELVGEEASELAVSGPEVKEAA